MSPRLKASSPVAFKERAAVAKAIDETVSFPEAETVSFSEAETVSSSSSSESSSSMTIRLRPSSEGFEGAEEGAEEGLGVRSGSISGVDSFASTPSTSFASTPSTSSSSSISSNVMGPVLAGATDASRISTRYSSRSAATAFAASPLERRSAAS